MTDAYLDSERNDCGLFKSSAVRRFRRMAARWQSDCLQGLLGIDSIGENKEVALPAERLSVAKLLVERILARNIFFRAMDLDRLNFQGNLRQSLLVQWQDLGTAVLCSGSGPDSEAIELPILGRRYDELNLDRIPFDELNNLMATPEAETALYLSSPNLARLLGLLHEDFLNAQRHQGGVYYTPLKVVHHLVAQCIELLDKQWTTTQQGWGRALPAVIDPACGSGVFLVETFNRLLQKDHLIGGLAHSTNLPLRLLKESIHGVDLDEHAVEMTRLALLRCVLAHVHGQGAGLGGPHSGEEYESWAQRMWSVAVESLSSNIRQGNALLDRALRSAGKTDEADGLQAIPSAMPFDWHLEFPHVFLGGDVVDDVVGDDVGDATDTDTATGGYAGSGSGSDQDSGQDPEHGFDLVIGNPPFISFSGKHRIRKKHGELIRQIESQIIERFNAIGGWPATHSFFINLATRMLSRNLIAFVVPAQVGQLEGYRPIRKYVCQRHHLLQVAYWGEDVFADAFTPVMTFVSSAIARQTGNAIQTEILFNPDTCATVTNSNNSGCMLGDGEYASGEPWLPSVSVLAENAWAGSAFSTKALNRVPAGNTGMFTLGKLVTDNGVHTGNAAHMLLRHAQSADGTTVVPLLEGRQIFSHGCAKPVVALDLAVLPESGVYFRIPPVENIQTVCYLIRQTASRPIVGPKTHALYYRNSLIGLREPESVYGLGFNPGDFPVDVRYLSGILNSRFMGEIYSMLAPDAGQKAFPQVKVKVLRSLPFPMVETATQEALHARLVQLVKCMEFMVATNHKEGGGEGESEGKRKRNDLAASGASCEESSWSALNNEIEQVVWELYGGNTPAQVVFRL